MNADSNVIEFPLQRPLLGQLRRPGPTKKIQYMYCWLHDIEAPEYQTLSTAAKVVYIAILAECRSVEQECELGMGRLSNLSGIARQNVPACVKEIEAAGLIRVVRCHRKAGELYGDLLDTPPRKKGERDLGKRHMKNRYALMTAPSAMRPSMVPKEQLMLPFRRLAMHEFQAQRRQHP